MRALVRSGAPERAFFLVCFGMLAGCHRTEATGPAPEASASARSALPPALADRVLAKVGDRTITLGDYQAVLDGMDRFERLRYQTADRRKQLLDEIIDVELLAHEAERRGLAKQPETQELVRQILRDAVVRELRDKQPSPADVPTSEVRAYYDAHHGDFREPERRRLADVAVTDRALADRILAAAKTASPKEWGGLVEKYSKDNPPPDVPVELAGDLGMVTPPSFGKNDNPRVPEAVRAAAFEIPEPGTVLDHVVADGKTFHVVRLIGKSAARDRSFEEAERTIRIRIVENKLHAAEANLERELRARFPVQVDDAALDKVSVPPASSATP